MYTQNDPLNTLHKSNNTKPFWLGDCSHSCEESRSLQISNSKPGVLRKKGRQAENLVTLVTQKESLQSSGERDK